MYYMWVLQINNHKYGIIHKNADLYKNALLRKQFNQNNALKLDRTLTKLIVNKEVAQHYRILCKI